LRANYQSPAYLITCEYHEDDIWIANDDTNWVLPSNIAGRLHGLAKAGTMLAPTVRRPSGGRALNEGGVTRAGYLDAVARRVGRPTASHAGGVQARVHRLIARALGFA
jgi:hypothetical protein